MKKVVFLTFGLLICGKQMKELGFSVILATASCWKWLIFSVYCFVSIWQLSVALFLLSFIHTNTPENTTEPSGWSRHGAICYYYSHRKSWLWDAPELYFYMPRKLNTHQHPIITTDQLPLLSSGRPLHGVYAFCVQILHSYDTCSSDRADDLIRLWASCCEN